MVRKNSLQTRRFAQILLLITFLNFHETTSASIASPTSTFNATYACSIVQNGTTLKDPRTCNTWIQCIDQKPISGTCPNGKFFDRNTNNCVQPDSIKCYSSEPCASVTTKNGTFVDDPYSCNSYYYCSDGVATLGMCSSGLNYNPETQICIRNYTCPANRNPDDWCNIIPDGQFFADSTICRNYHSCKMGILENGTCPDGYYFNALKSVCDYEKNVMCPQNEKHVNTPKSGDGICQTAGQFVSDNRTCSGYYYCQEKASGEYQLISQNCSNGKFFVSSDGGKCGFRRDVACEYDRCDRMGLDRIELVNGQADECRGYLICQDGQQIGKGLCPDAEKYFDEELQKCTNDTVTYPACLKNTNTNR